MDVRELAELIHGIKLSMWGKSGLSSELARNMYLAESLIANGVTVQELGGCEYCKEDSEGFRRMFGAFSLVNPFHGKTWQIHAGKCKPREINFCPMCGRRLPQSPKGE